MNHTVEVLKGQKTVTELYAEFNGALEDRLGQRPNYSSYGVSECGGRRLQGPHTTFMIKGKRSLAQQDITFIIQKYMSLIDRQVVEATLRAVEHSGGIYGHSWYQELTLIHRHLTEAEKDTQNKVNYKNKSCVPGCEDCKSLEKPQKHYIFVPGLLDMERGVKVLLSDGY